MKSSLHTSLLALWLLIAVICLVLASLILNGFENGVGAQVRSTTTLTEKAAETLRTRFGYYLKSFDPQLPTDWTDPIRRRELEVILQMGLANYSGVEGGFWIPTKGNIAYAFPSYGGDAVKKDVPEAEKARITSAAQSAAESGETAVSRRFDGSRDSLVITSRAVSLKPELVVWTMARAQVAVGAAYQRLTWVLIGLITLALVTGFLVMLVLQRWRGRLRALENSLANISDPDFQLAETGQVDLDRIVSAFNHLNHKLSRSRTEARQLAMSLARAERSSAVGRMAAQLAHEIRNPLAAARLRAENALTKDSDSQAAALRTTLAEILRVNDSLERLLAMTRLSDLKCERIDLRSWLQSRLEAARPGAEEKNIALRLQVPSSVEAEFDPRILAGAVDNVLLNALQHVPQGGIVQLSGGVENGMCRIVIEDNGPGIAAEIREEIFEPFTTGRSDGTGLGLSITREAVEAHGGRVRLEEGETGGACFVIELPQSKN